jgi:hypothetical protein
LKEKEGNEMNGTNNELQTDQKRKALTPTRRRVVEGWTRRINLDPMRASRLAKKLSGRKRRRLTITSFSATTFAVGWKHIDEKVGLAADCEKGSELAPGRLMMFSL